MPDIPYKKEVPDYRTIVPGVWSDILNEWSESLNNGAQSVSITNTDDLLKLLILSMMESESISRDILEQSLLLNARFEETFNTRIKETDL